MVLAVVGMARWKLSPVEAGLTSLLLGKLSKGWKNSGVITAGSGRPVSATVIGDANQDDNGNSDRLPGASRNSFAGPNYSTTDMRLSRKVYAKNGWRLEFTVESFNLFNRLNARYRITDDGLMNNQAPFNTNYGTKKLGINYFPAYYQVPTNFMKATSAYARARSNLLCAWDSRMTIQETNQTGKAFDRQFHIVLDFTRFTCNN